MAYRDDYAQWIVNIAPIWMRGPWGSKFLQGLGYLNDVIAETARLAVKARFIAQAPDDALPYIGDERQIPQGPSETNAAYRLRLEHAWTSWEKAGTKAAIIEQLNAYGLPNVEVFQAQGDNFQIDTNTSNWSRFVVIVHQSFPFSKKLWGASSWGTDTTWGSTASAADVTSIRRLIRVWKSAHSIGVKIIFVYAEHVWEPSLTWGSETGVWGADTMEWYLAKFWDQVPYWDAWGGAVWGAYLD